METGARNATVGILGAALAATVWALLPFVPDGRQWVQVAGFPVAALASSAVAVLRWRTARRRGEPVLGLALGATSGTLWIALWFGLTPLLRNPFCVSTVHPDGPGTVRVTRRCALGNHSDAETTVHPVLFGVLLGPGVPWQG